jgi:hypothetical protein
MAPLMVLALVLQPILERLADDDVEMRDAAERELRRQGLAAVPTLEAGLTNADAHVRNACLQLLAERINDLPVEVVDRNAALAEMREVGWLNYMVDRLGRVRLASPGYATRASVLEENYEARELLAMGRRAVPFLLAKLEEDPFVIAPLLGLFDDARAAEALDRLASTSTMVTYEMFDVPVRAADVARRARGWIPMRSGLTSHDPDELIDALPEPHPSTLRMSRDEAKASSPAMAEVAALGPGVIPRVRARLRARQPYLLARTLGLFDDAHAVCILDELASRAEVLSFSYK